MSRRRPDAVVLDDAPRLSRLLADRRWRSGLSSLVTVAAALVYATLVPPGVLPTVGVVVTGAVVYLGTTVAVRRVVRRLPGVVLGHDDASRNLVTTLSVLAESRLPGASTVVDRFARAYLAGEFTPEFEDRPYGRAFSSVRGSNLADPRTSYAAVETVAFARSRDPSDPLRNAFDSALLRVVAALPLDAEWLPSVPGFVPLVVARGLSVSSPAPSSLTLVASVADDLESGAPLEWALRRLGRAS